MKLTLFHLLLVLSLAGCTSGTTADRSTVATHVKRHTDHRVLYDSHVHLMSPYLIAYWKQLGIPFSRTDAHYADVDTILRANGAEKIDLIGMGYVYTNPEYYEGNDAQQRLQQENDYLLEQSAHHPQRIRPFIAVDPLQDFALSELARCFARLPSAGVKLHFSTSQVYLTEPEHLTKVKAVFSASAKQQAPILLHFDNWHPKFGADDLTLLVDSILAPLPALDLRIAHFGTSGGFSDKTKRFVDAYLALRREGRIPERHTLRLDISAVALDKDSEGVEQLTESEFAELRAYIDRIGFENISFGTDYPLYSSAAYSAVLRERLGLDSLQLESMMRP